METPPGGGTNQFRAQSKGDVAGEQQQQKASLLSSNSSTADVVASRSSRGARRPYRPGSFLSRSRFASSVPTTSAASSSAAAVSKDALSPSAAAATTQGVCSPMGFYARSSAASSGNTLATTSASAQSSSSTVWGEKTATLPPDVKMGGDSQENLGFLQGGRRTAPAYSQGPTHAQYLDLGPEEDDWLHEVKSEWKNHKRRYVGIDQRGSCLRGFRGCVNVCCIVILSTKHTTKEGHGLGGTNSSGQVPDFGSLRTGLIDPDTPTDAYTSMSIDGTRKMNLIFSDEFNTPGRSFYPGDDPFWAAENLEYWETGDVEWYDPAAITTKDGALVITLSEHVTHNKNFRSGMMNTWNKFCFTGGRVEVAVTLPGSSKVSGFWPAVWTMGNLGRAGYGATTEGTWPYSYDSCDVGTLPNQTYPDDQGGGPEAAVSGGDKDGSLSYLPGQRLSRCTCPGEDHPGPLMSDGTLRGRGAPEIDIFEASAGETYQASQSLQSAPYNAKYHWPTTNGGAYFAPGRAKKNTYEGGHYQEAISAVSQFSEDAFEMDGDVFNVMGMEYRPGLDDDAYMAWLTDGKLTWSVHPPAVGPDKITEINARPFPQEPMYVLINLGMSSSFAWPDWKKLEFPAHLKVDWIRIYQPEGEENVGCDPPGFPTKAYIDKHMEAYKTPNMTTWTEPRGARGGYGGTFPKNRLLEKC